ncbi:MAG TPA: ATP-binding protein [Candidatus Kapabacteria bacterium]|nr:ATP-binding protein [Candidatus Kapabacteria bacterium]
MPVIQNELVVAVIGVGNKATDYIDEDLESLTEISNTLSSLILQKEYEQKLIAHQTIIELILNNLNSIVYISNIQTYDIIFINDYGSKVLGGDLIGQKYWDKIFGQTEPCEYCSNKYFSIETELVHNQVSYELFNNKTGIWYEVTDSPIRWHDGHIFKLSVIRDISTRKESEQQTNDLVHQLQISNNTKDKFFSIIAHDLRNPLGTFMSMAAVLYNDYSYFEENEKLDFLKTMRDSSRNIYNLLENLLEWSSSQSGMIKLKPFPSNLYNLVKTTIDLVTNLATSKSISITNLIPQKLIVNIDPNIISTVIRNLLTNSIKFTPKNGKIEINCINDNGIKLYISDNGIGMDEAKLTNLFNSDLNASSLGTAKEVGSGLGLLLCKDLIEKHKGTISVESTLNQGTTFYINLPWL